MEQELAITMELDSTDSSMELDSRDPNLSLQSRGHSYLEKIRSLPVVSAGDGGSSSWSSRSARSTHYSTTMSTSLSGGGSHNHRYAPYWYSCTNRMVVRLDVNSHRDIARQMVRDRFMMNLIREFSRGPDSVLERWFFELDVGFVLRSAPEPDLNDLVRRWTQGLTVMAQALSATHRHIKEERSTVESHTAASDDDDEMQDDLRFAQFAEETISKMLAFADVVLAAAGNTWRQPTDKLLRLMDVHIYTIDVEEIIIPLLEKEALWLPNLQKMERIVQKISNVFSSTEDSTRKAIHVITVEAEAVTPVLSRDSWETFLDSAEIHKVTHLIMDYARLFWEHQDELNSILLQRYSFRWEVRSLITQMMSNLMNQLEKKSESLSDPSLRYLFLLNNSCLIQDEFLSITGYTFPLDSDTRLTYWYYEDYYLNVSWDTVLSCLHVKAPLLFFKHSPMARFESEFQRTCRHQKLWKVPNPELRKSLRKAIIDKVITGPTGYKRYLEDHPDQEKCSIDPQDMEDMVNELFEG